MKNYLTWLLLLWLVGAASAQDKAPKLALETFEHDFGKVIEGRKISHTFQLKNEGTADLLIEGVAPS